MHRIAPAARLAALPALGIALTVAFTLALGACATKQSSERKAAQEALLSAPVADADAKLPRFQIRDWSAPNDHTIIVTANDGTRYRAETFGPCLGLDFTTRLAFENRGGFEQVDRFSSVRLGDGTRCQFQSFGKLKSQEASALDSYEKSQKSGDTDSAEKPEPKSDEKK